MFSSVDKALAAAISSAVMYLVAQGWLSAEQGAALGGVITTLITAGVTLVVTYLVPNKTK